MSPNKAGQWKGTTRGGVWGYQFFILLINLFGVKAAYGFLSLVVIYFIPFAPKATKAIWKFGRQRLNYNSFRTIGLLFRNYYRLGQTLIDKVAIQSGKKELFHFDFGEQYEDFLKLLNSNQGVILIGAHVGNWEIGAPFFDKYGKRMNVVMFDNEYQQIKELLSQQIKERNYKVIPVNEDGISSMLKIKNALDAQEYVCFQGDRFLQESQTLTIPFMGQNASFPAGPYLLASRMKVPVVFYFAMREKGMRYSFHFVFPEVESLKGKSGERTLLKQYIQTLEKIVDQYPEQWFNYYDFWKQS